MADSTAPPARPHGDSAHESPDEHDSSCLPLGTRLGEFEVTGLVGVGGFGIVYSARDHLLEREVAIKEYMPSSLATRSPDYRVTVKSERHQETFGMGLRSFVNEAKLLAQFDHPSLVKVYRFWEANGTAYMVMPYYRGTTLRSALKTLGEAPDEAAVLQLIRPMLDALDVIHAEHCYHRDIAPDNIMILQSGRPVLLDFGAARRVIGDVTQALTVILKPGFAPVEQYANGPEMRQGPWTDIYALAAVIYYCIGGKTPTPSVSRMMRDTLVPARELGRGHYSEKFLTAVDHALAVHIEERTASVAQLREELGLQEVVEQHSRTRLVAAPSAPPAASRREAAPVSAQAMPADETTVPMAAGLPTFASNTPVTTLPVPVPVPVPVPAPAPAAAPAGRVTAEPRPPAALLAPAAQTAANTSRPNRTGLAVAAIAGVLAIAGGGAWLLMGGNPSSSPPTAAVAPTPASGPSAAPTPTPVPGSAPSMPPVPSPAVAVQTPAAPPVPVPALVPAAPSPLVFSPQAVVESLFELRDPDWPVTVKLRSNTLRIERDNLQFRVTSQRAGHLYVIQVGTDTAHFWQLFPNGSDRNNRIDANKELTLPRASWSVLSSGPAGLNRLIAIVTPSPRDFSKAGLQATTATSFIGEFDLTQARAVWSSEGPAAFAGKPVGCTLDAPACAKFGAARFDIQEVN